jgi:hypothetical protein
MEMCVVVLVVSPINNCLVVDIEVWVKNPREMESHVDQDGKGSIPITEDLLAQ